MLRLLMRWVALTLFYRLAGGRVARAGRLRRGGLRRLPVRR